MKAVVLQGTLKREGQSNTQALAEFFSEKLRENQISCEIVRLAKLNIFAGTYSDMGPGDDWPRVLEKILVADILVFATPIWWGNQSSEMQRVVERLDEIHDGILEGKPSPLEGKLGVILVTGDSDGAQHIIGNMSNFFNAIGVVLLPYASLTVLWDGHNKGADTSRQKLMEKYERDYSQTAQKLIDQLLRYN